MWYQIRIDTDKPEALNIIKQFNDRFNVQKGLACFEISKIEKKKHIHYSYLVENPMKSSSLSSFMNKLNKKGKYSNKAHQDNKKAFMYIVKDSDIIFNTAFSDEHLEHLKEEQLEYNKQIEEDKGLDLVDKLYNYVVKELGIEEGDDYKDYPDCYEISDLIVKFHQERKIKHYPNKTQMFVYIATISGRFPSQPPEVVTQLYSDIFPRVTPEEIENFRKFEKNKKYLNL